MKLFLSYYPRDGEDYENAERCCSRDEESLERTYEKSLFLCAQGRSSTSKGICKGGKGLTRGVKGTSVLSFFFLLVSKRLRLFLAIFFFAIFIKVKPARCF